MTLPAPNQMILRDYQDTGKNRFWDSIAAKEHPLLVLPCGAGKTPVGAAILNDCRMWDGRAILVTHVKELALQMLHKLQLINPNLYPSVCSGSLGSHDTDAGIVIGTIQTLVRRIKDLGHRDLVLIDECFIGSTKISTPFGNQRIDSLKIGDEVCNAFGFGFVTGVSCSFVSKIMEVKFTDGKSFYCTPNHPVFTDGGWVKASELVKGSSAFGFQELFELREAVRTNKEKRFCHVGKAMGEAKILFDILRLEIEESNEDSWGEGEDDGNLEANWSQANSSRRERRSSASSGCCFASCSWRRLGSRSSCSNEDEARFRVSKLLQSGHWKSGNEDCHRGGREFSWCFGAKEVGSEKRSVPDRVRVESVSRIQLASPRAVFNIQVSGHPSYFAEGKLVHNCHLVGHNPESSYQKLIKGLTEINPKLAVGGMTATPWRLRQGEIWGEGATFSRVVFEISIKELIERGYLVPVTSKDAMEIDLSQVKISRATGDYKEGELEQAFRAVDGVTRMVDDMLTRSAARKRVIVFCTGQEHARDVVACLKDRGRKAELVLGTTPQTRRDSIIEDFKRGEFDFLVAVRCLTTGFDCPEVDCVVLFTATISPVLYSQMVGRGMRPAEGKKNALVLDYGGNAMRHGPIDNVQPPRKPGERTGDAPTKKCLKCSEVVFAGCHFCPECGYAFEFASKLDALDFHAADSELMDAPVEPPVDVPIAGWEYRIHRKPNKPPVLRVIYQFDLYPEASEWIPFESQDRYGQLKARRWWKERSYFPLPSTVKEAHEIASAGGLARPLLAKARFTGKYPEIVAVEVASKPPITEHNQPRAFREFAGPVSEFWERAKDWERDYKDQELPF